MHSTTIKEESQLESEATSVQNSTGATKKKSDSKTALMSLSSIDNIEKAPCTHNSDIMEESSSSVKNTATGTVTVEENSQFKAPVVKSFSTNNLEDRIDEPLSNNNNSVIKEETQFKTIGIDASILVPVGCLTSNNFPFRSEALRSASLNRFINVPREENGSSVKQKLRRIGKTIRQKFR